MSTQIYVSTLYCLLCLTACKSSTKGNNYRATELQVKGHHVFWTWILISVWGRGPQHIYMFYKHVFLIFILEYIFIVQLGWRLWAWWSEWNFTKFNLLLWFVSIYWYFIISLDWYCSPLKKQLLYLWMNMPQEYRNWYYDAFDFTFTIFRIGNWIIIFSQPKICIYIFCDSMLYIMIYQNHEVVLIY